MKKLISLSIAILLCSISLSQSENRVTLAGSRISIIRPESVLIPKHTSTLFIDSTVEFASLEFKSTVEAIQFIKNEMNSYNHSTEQRQPIEIGPYTGEIIITDYGPSHKFLHSYFGDSGVAVLSQCIYKKSQSTEMEHRLISIIESMRIESASAVDLEKYLSFTFDPKSIFKPVPTLFAVSVAFTPNGVKIDSLFNETNIRVQQFPPAPSVKSSQDLMMVAVSGLLELDIVEVLFDGQMDQKNDAYRFSARCRQNGKSLILTIVTYYDPKSAVLVSCHIVDDKFSQETESFISSIQHKRDGY